MEVGILIILLVLILIIRFNYAKIRGWLGEKSVAAILKLLPAEYTIFNDVYIDENGKSSQIDHVVFSPYGVFVIETKNYKGWIYGGEKQTYWIKNMYGKKYQFYNPIFQNNSHVGALQSLLGLPRNCFVPIVVFIGGATLKMKYPDNYVVYGYELLRTIKRFKDVILQNDVLSAAINKLSYSSFKTRDTSSEHIKQVKAEVKDYRESVKHGVCPRCGGKLVYHQGQYGPFWGCSNYPKCRFTAKAQ